MYSVTSTITTAGQCSAVSGPPAQISALTFGAPSGAGVNVVLTSARETFLSYIGLPTCVPGGSDRNFATTLTITVHGASDFTPAATTMGPSLRVANTISALIVTDMTTPTATLISLASLNSESSPSAETCRKAKGAVVQSSQHRHTARLLNNPRLAALFPTKS